MSALPASSTNRVRSFGWDGSSTELRLLALCSANRRLVPRNVGGRVRDGLPPGGSTFNTSAPKSTSRRVTASPSSPDRSRTRSDASSPRGDRKLGVAECSGSPPLNPLSTTSTSASVVGGLSPIRPPLGGVLFTEFADNQVHELRNRRACEAFR
jgi:hypothetical protein